MTINVDNVYVAGVPESKGLVGGGLDAEYRFNDSTAIADPGSGFAALNNADPNLATEIYISVFDTNGVSQIGILQLRDGDAIKLEAIQHDGLSAFELTGVPVDNGTWYTLPVVNKLTQNLIVNNSKILVTAIFSGAAAYLDLNDTPEDYIGDGGKFLAVNSLSDGVEHRGITTSDLGSGVADNTKYLRGDLTWSEVSGGITEMVSAPTATTNGTLYQQVWVPSEARLYICIDATTDDNVWAVFVPEAYVNNIQTFAYPGGTLTDGEGADSVANASIAETDIIWAVGTDFGASNFSNPIDGARIIQSNSGIYNGGGAVDQLSNRGYGGGSRLVDYMSEDESNSYFRLDFGSDKKIRITRYSLQHRSFNTIQYFRTVQISYSTDGATYTPISSATSSGNSVGEWFNVVVTGSPFARYIEFKHTSNDSSNSNYLFASELLLWGEIEYV